MENKITELRARTQPMLLRAGTIVRHFKGKLYQVVGIAVHTETAEEMVIYQALYPPFTTYARPKDMFMSKVDEEKYPEHAGEWRLRMATPEEIQGQGGTIHGKADPV